MIFTLNMEVTPIYDIDYVSDISLPQREVKSRFDIGLRFPFATQKTYVIPYTTAMNSGFIENMISRDRDEGEILNENEFHYEEFEIPLSFYRRLRPEDLDKFMDMWTGKETMHSVGCIYLNMVEITQLCRALLLNTNLVFVKQFEDQYPHVSY